MKFEKTVNIIVTENHMDDFDYHLKNMTVAELLGVLENAHKGNIKIYKALENWIKDTYPDHIESKKSDKFEDEPHDIESMPGIEDQY